LNAVARLKRIIALASLVLALTMIPVASATFAPAPSTGVVQNRIFSAGSAQRSARLSNSGKAGDLDFGGIRQTPSSYVWQSLGPSGIKNCGVLAGTSWNVVSGGLCSGRVTSIAVDPRKSNTIYVGTASGGVWKSADSGSTWTPITDGIQTPFSLAVGAIAVDPNGVIYVGTGEGNNALDNHFGSGLLKSTDGGDTWTEEGNSTFAGMAFTRIVVNPQNPSMVLATTSVASYGGTTTGSRLLGPADSNPPGVYVSTDAGNTWAPTLVSNPKGCQYCPASDIILDPTNPSTVYAAVAYGIYSSSDGGTTWSGPLENWNAGRINLAMSGSTLYAAADITTNPNGNPPDQGELFESTDGGNSWTTINSPSTTSFPSFCTWQSSGQCWYDLYVEVDPANSNIIYLGGQDLWRTTDGGSTWTDLGGYAGYIHADQHAFAFSPTSPDTIYVGNDGGIWSSTNASTCDPSSCWTNLNAGLATNQVTSVAAHPTDPGTILAASQDNAEWELTPNHTWSMLYTGDSGWVAFDSNSPLTIYHTFHGANIERSDAGGAFDSWQDINNGIADDPAEFYVPVAMDHTSPNILYLGTYRLYKTTDHGDDWTLPSPGLPLPAPSDCYSGECLTAITVAPSDGSYVYVGTNMGRIFVSTDGATTFTDVTPTNLLPTNAQVTKIAVDPTNPQKVYATLLPGMQGARILASSDAGGSWSDISSNLPSLAATVVLADSHGWIYVGLDDGVYVSTDGGANWSRLGTGLPEVDVRDLTLSANGTLIAGTYGRGVWALSTIPPTPTVIYSIPMSWIIGLVVVIVLVVFVVRRRGRGVPPPPPPPPP